MQTEFVDIVDENDKPTGEQEKRSIAHERKLWHRHVLCWIMNEKGEILLQKRASTRKVNPNIWGKIGGHALAGESTEQAIQREIKEEVGINVSSNSIKLLDIEKIDTEKDCFFAYDYLVLVNYKVEEYVVQKEELSEVKYYTIEEIEKAITTQDHKFIFSQRNATRLLEKCEILKRERKLILENS